MQRAQSELAQFRSSHQCAFPALSTPLPNKPHHRQATHASASSTASSGCAFGVAVLVCLCPHAHSQPASLPCLLNLMARAMHQRPAAAAWLRCARCLCCAGPPEHPGGGARLHHLPPGGGAQGERCWVHGRVQILMHQNGFWDQNAGFPSGNASRHLMAPSLPPCLPAAAVPSGGGGCGGGLPCCPLLLLQGKQ